MSKQKEINGFTRARMLCELGMNAMEVWAKDSALYDLIRAVGEIAGELERQQNEKRN
jgi:hypothetical protein